jgi:hypothetical protein
MSHKFLVCRVFHENMVKKFAGKAAGAAGTVAKKAAKSAVDSAKRHVIDEVTKPVKKAAKDKLSAMTSGIKAKAVQKLERKK